MKRVLNYNGIDYYLLNELINQHPTYKYICDREELKTQVFSFFGERYITADTWKSIADIISKEENYYSAHDVLLRFEYKGGYTEVNNDLFVPLNAVLNPVMFDGKPYYKKTEIDEIDSIGKLYSEFSGIDVVTGMELVWHHNKNRMYHQGNLYISEYHLRFLYHREDILTINGKLCIRKNKTKNPYDDFKNRCIKANEMTYFDNYFGTVKKYVKTYEMIRKYYISRINGSKSVKRERVASSLIIMFYEFYSQLVKEIYLYSEKEVATILMNPMFSVSKDFMHFLNYVKKEYPAFTPDVVTYYIKADNSVSYDAEIFTPEEFATIYNEAINIPRHVDNAYNDHAYAQYWLYILFQLSDFVRGSDILNLPILELPYEYEWGYFCDNEIDMTEAQIICNICKIEARNILIGKTGEHKRLYLLKNQVQALAIALVICIGHAKRRNLALLFSYKNPIGSDRIYNKLGEPFYGIGNRKMNYTLATYFEATGNEAAEYRSRVYNFLSYMRGHKGKNSLAFSDTTAIYIKAANKDQSINEVSYHTTQRGAFGWLYHILLDYIGEEFDSLEEETERIMELSGRYIPMQVENIADFTMNIQKERINVLKTLASIPKETITSFLSSIGTVGTFKMTQELPCIFGKKCLKPGANCAYCEFSIKTVYSLQVYHEEIYKILDILETTNDYDVVQKNMYLMYKVLSVIKEFRKEFGKDYISAFIDLRGIQERVSGLPQKHVKALEELINDK